MQIFKVNVSLYLTMHISNHITTSSYTQYLIFYENFQFSNFKPFMQIHAKITKVTKIILAQFVSLNRSTRCCLELSSILNSQVFLPVLISTLLCKSMQKSQRLQKLF